MTIAELESDRQILTTHYDKKSKDTFLGLMQISPKTALWLVRYSVNGLLLLSCYYFLVFLYF